MAGACALSGGVSRNHKKRFDKPRTPACVSVNMSSSQPAQAKSNGFKPAQIAVDFVLCALFFSLIFYYVRSHVMTEDSTLVLVFSTYTTICVTGVFWMAIQMLRVVAEGEKQIKASRSGH